MNGSINRRVALIVLVSLSAILLVECNKSEDNPVNTPAVLLLAPTNLRAYSASQSSVGLQWDLSASESNAAFLNYSIKVKDSTGAAVLTQTVSKGNPQSVITGLTEGVTYTFVIRSNGTGGIVSADSASVVWSPARRLTTDSTNGPPIQVYEFASSSGASGLQFYSISSGAARTQSLRASNPDRALADVYLETNLDGSISLNNMAISPVPNPKNTFFSSVMRDANDLDDPQLAPPASSTYTLNTVTIPSAVATQAKILYARSVIDNKYVRILLQKNPATNLLYYSVSPNRYVRVQLSYQNRAGNVYAQVPPSLE